MALSDTQRESRQYRQKVNEFIQLAGSLAEQSSETEDDSEDDDDEDGTCQGRPSGRYRRQHYRSNGELVSGSDSLTASCSTSSDSLHHSCDSACSGANHSGTNSSAGSESSSCHSGVKAPPGGSTYHSHSQHSHHTPGPSASSSSGTFRRASTTSTPGTTSLNCNRIQSRSIISDIFTGELENTIRCTACNSVSVQIESFQDLSIPISIIDKAMHSKYRNPQSKTPPFEG